MTPKRQEFRKNLARATIIVNKQNHRALTFVNFAPDRLAQQNSYHRPSEEITRFR
jgi:hypothetical protein